MNSLQRFVRAQRQRVGRNVRRVRAAVRERIRGFVLGLLGDEFAYLRNLRAEIETLRAQIPDPDDFPDESDVEAKIEAAFDSADITGTVDKAVESALENYDFSDAIQSALEDEPDPGERIAEILRNAADAAESGKPRRRR